MYFASVTTFGIPFIDVSFIIQPLPKRVDRKFYFSVVECTMSYLVYNCKLRRLRRSYEVSWTWLSRCFLSCVGKCNKNLQMSQICNAGDIEMVLYQIYLWNKNYIFLGIINIMILENSNHSLIIIVYCLLQIHIMLCLQKANNTNIYAPAES